MMRPRPRGIAIWLFVCCAMTFVMVVLGGLTRLTHSGLSMVEWRPLTGWLPPLDEATWRATFEAYQHYPEFHKVNADMTLAGFKRIFWLEFIHRLWGRILGLAFFLPFLYFAVTRALDTSLWRRCIAIFVLGGMQGVMGWTMVMSGLVDRPDVSQYRLTAHLALAFLLLGYMLWVAFGLWWNAAAPSAPSRRVSLTLLTLVSITVISGGFVAGTDAGFAYNTFPLMAGQWIPEQLFMLTPVWRNFADNLITVQFTHRVLALTTFACIGVFWWHARRLARGRAVRALDTLLALAALQVTLGISTLLLRVPLLLAAAHQATALLLFAAAVWVTHEAWRVRAPSR